MRTLILSVFLLSFAQAQTPPIEPGVSQELAKWRAAHYSDVRYTLNLTLEKMSPVLKGTIEIRVSVRRGDPETRGRGEAQSVPPASAGAAAPSTDPPPIIIDWRKIKGYEDRSTVANVSINGKALEMLGSSTTPSAEAAATPPKTGGESAPTSLLRKEGSPERPLTFSEQNEHLIFRDGVVAGENVIKLDFTSPILPSGSAITRYVDKEDGAEYIYSLFVPSDASTAFPVFDQPDLKARFKLEVRRPDDWHVVTNSKWDELISIGGCIVIPPTRPNAPGCSGRIGFDETKPISTYVFAFAAGPWQQVSVPPAVAGGSASKESQKPRNVKPELKEAYKKWLNTDVSVAMTKVEAEAFKNPPATAGGTDKTSDPATSIYVRKSQLAKFQPHAAEVFRLNREGIKFLETYFDYKFPFPKYDLVLIPEFPFGGMEHAGATFLRESSVIFPQEPTKNDHISRANLIFHEAAHQWFGDTVTMKWFDDLWLKEGFAEFMAYKTLEKVTPEYNAWKVFYERNKQAAYLTDSTKGTTPIYQEIKNLNSAKSAYGNIVYRKAPSFLKQAEFYIGPDKFQVAVRAFLKKHEFANAGWGDLVAEFENQRPKHRAGYEKQVREFASTWVTKKGTKVIRTSFSVDEDPFVRYQLHHSSDSPFDGLENLIMEFQCLVVYKDGTRSVEKVGLRLERSSIDVIHRLNRLPIAVIPNSDDYGYGIFLLDERSRDYVLKNIQNEKDDFLRSMMWGALWDSVRESELDPKEFVELVLRVLSPASIAKAPKGVIQNGEDETTVATLLNRVSTAMTYYLADKQRIDIAPRLEALLIDKMRTAPTLGQRITYYRAFLNVASTDMARSTLKDILNLKFQISDLKLKTKDRFDIVTKLVSLGDPDAEKLLTDLEKSETSDDAKRYAYAARAAFPTKEAKAKFWSDFTANKEISESWIEAAFGPFNSVRHADLTLPYLERALKELPNHKRNRKIFFVNGWLAAFIGGQKSEEALAVVNKFLADNPNLDRDLRLKILENVDVIERAVKIRAKFATR